jgi:hypothetical protein
MEDFKTPGFSTGRRGSSMRPVDSRQTAADTADEPGTMNPRSNSLAAYAKPSAAILGSLVFPVLAHAQNCALCYTQAAGSGQRFIQALRSGILILMLPPMAISIGIAVMAYRKRNQFNED